MNLNIRWEAAVQQTTLFDIENYQPVIGHVLVEHPEWTKGGEGWNGLYKRQANWEFGIPWSPLCVEHCQWDSKCGHTITSIRAEWD